MPKIAPQHRWKDSDHVPSSDWPDDCYVQWGRSGLVIGDSGQKSYTTAFFEAFPEGGGFIRGEGADLNAAEDNAFAKFLKISACTHIWGRGKYTNGGAICRCCGAFQVIFKEIPKLGEFKKPLDASTLSMLAEGYMRPDERDAKSHRYARRAWLKAKRMGVDLPDFESAPRNNNGFEEDDYARACKQAVARFLIANEGAHTHPKETAGGMQAFFEGLGSASLRWIVEEYRSEMENAEGKHPPI